MSGNTWLKAAGFIILAALVAYLQVCIDGMRRYLPGAETVMFLPSSEYLRVASMGHEQLTADALLIKAIGYMTKDVPFKAVHRRGVEVHYHKQGGCRSCDEHAHVHHKGCTHVHFPKDFSQLYNYIDVITDLDPQYAYPYKWAGMVLGWKANKVDQAIAILKKGALQHPEDYEFPYYIGMYYYCFHGDNEQAGQWMKRAARLPGHLPSVPHIAAWLLARDRDPREGIRFLSELREQEQDEEVRWAIEKRILKLKQELGREMPGVRETEN